MADLDDSKVNDLEVGVIGSGSMGAVSRHVQREIYADLLGYDTFILRTWITSRMFRYRQGSGPDGFEAGKGG
jgi:hypothetical protein